MESINRNAVTIFDMGNQKSKFKPQFTSSWQGKNTEHAGQEKKDEPIVTEVFKAYGPPRRFFNCNSPKHIARDCPEKKNVSKNKPLTVKQCLVVNRFNRDVSLEKSFEKLTDVTDCALRTQCDDANCDADTGDVFHLMNINVETVVESEAVNCIDVNDNASFKVATLNYVDVLIDGKRYKAFGRLWL